MRYVYPAVFSRGEDAVTVYYPDLACISQGDDYLDAFKSAREGLTLHLYGMLADGEELPEPSRLEEIELEQNEAIALIEVDLTGFKPEWELDHEQEG